MGSTSPKDAATTAQRKEQRRPNTSPSAKPTTPKRPVSRGSSKSRSQAIWAPKFARLVALKARGITQRITRSMAQKEAEANALSQDGTPSPPPDLMNIPVDHPLDSPDLFPTILDRVIPRIDLCGPHNCGSHRRVVGVLTLPSPPCRDCKVAGLPIGALHTLPCGHVLCLPCLSKQAAAIANGIYDAHVWDNIMQALHDDAYESTYYDYDGLPHGKPILQAAGMLCCGRDARLDRYLDCLDPAIATSYWIAHQVVRSAPDELRSHCGWPDCRRQLVPACEFRRDSCAFCYCPCCGGTSLVRPMDGTAVPARSWYGVG